MLGWFGTTGKKVGQFYWVHEIACVERERTLYGRSAELARPAPHAASGSEAVCELANASAAEIGSGSLAVDSPDGKCAQNPDARKDLTFGGRIERIRCLLSVMRKRVKAELSNWR